MSNLDGTPQSLYNLLLGYDERNHAFDMRFSELSAQDQKMYISEVIEFLEGDIPTICEDLKIILARYHPLSHPRISSDCHVAVHLGKIADWKYFDEGICGYVTLDDCPSYLPPFTLGNETQVEEGTPVKIVGITRGGGEISALYSVLISGRETPYFDIVRDDSSSANNLSHSRLTLSQARDVTTHLLENP